MPEVALDQLQVEPSTQGLSGEIEVPGDKSISHRAALIGAIAEGDTEIEGFLEAEDTHATMRALQQLGVNTRQVDEGYWVVEGVGLQGMQAPSSPLDCGNSGTTMRLLSGILAGQSFCAELVGDDSLMRRPMARIGEPLRSMGAQVEMAERGTAPIQITGKYPLSPVQFTLPIASAQVKSCCLFASLFAEGESIIVEPVVTRNHTEKMLAQFGVEVKQTRPNIYITGQQTLSASFVQVPGDISAAAFFMVAATILPDSDIVIRNVGINDTRIGVINILSLMGAKITLDNEQMYANERVADIRVRSAPLLGIDIPIDQVPLAIDEFPAIFIAASCAKGVTVLREAGELRYKESDRIAIMTKGLRRLGVEVQAREDGVLIEGTTELLGGTVDSGGDHRTAMAFAIAGLVAKNPVVVENCENIATSFPGFVEVAKTLGVRISSQ